MKAMPLPFEDFQGKGAAALDYFSSSSSSNCSDSLLLSPPHHHQQENWSKGEAACCYVGSEPTSVLDTRRSPSPPTSSSLGVAATHIASSEKCGLGMEDWETVLSGSPILRLIMGDIEHPSMGLQTGTGSHEHQLECNADFGLVDQTTFAFEPLITDPSSLTDFGGANNARLASVSNPTHIFSSSSPTNLLPQTVFQQHQHPQMTIHQNQTQYTQNPPLFLPLPYTQLQDHHLLSPPPPKRLHFGPSNQDSGQQELILLRRQQHQLQMLQQRQTTKQKMVSHELANQQQLIDQVFKAAELIETGNPVLAQGILARLNQQLSPIGNPFQRAAFYFKEALQSLLHMNTSNDSDYGIIFKIGAYKSFSEISPILQFANFTCNQALLEAFDGFERIHIIDFDIGYGGQWSSLMQELVLRSGGPPSLKITAFASPTTHEELELGFTRENLQHFASEINIPFDLEILSLESFNSSMNLCIMENEVIAVNLPMASFSNYPSTLPLVLRFVKQLAPKIVVSLDRGCDRVDVPFPHHVIHALQSYSGLLESLDAVNVNVDALQKIETFLIHPCIEKIVTGRHRTPERLPPWRTLFLQYGFSPLTFSNFTESQAECLVQRTPVRGFHVEKRQSSLVLCWQRKELISASAWRC